MRFVVAGYGSRGDIEPCAAVGVELARCRHEVRMAVPPNMLGFVESVGLEVAVWGPDLTRLHDNGVITNLSKMQNSVRVLPELVRYATQASGEMGKTLTVLADRAALLLTGTFEPWLAANVAEYYGIPLAVLHPFPVQALAFSWLDWRITQAALAVLRDELGLPEARLPPPALGDRGSLQIQAYDELFFPWLAREWVGCERPRPFAGALTLELPTDVDDDVLTWLASGTPPIYFGFGSTLLAHPRDTVEMISAACAELGERASVCIGENALTKAPDFDQVKVVRALNHAAIFPACLAVVHHGDAGTTAAGLRAGAPTLILWLWHDQPSWGAQVTPMKVRSAQPFWDITRESLVAELRAFSLQRARRACA